MASQPEIPLQYVSGLEPASQDFPEVSHRESRAPELAYYYNQDGYQAHPHPQPHPYPAQAYQAYHNLPIAPKPDDPYSSQIPLAGVGSPYPYSPNSQTAVLSQSGATIHKDDHKKILGCSRLVFFLSVAIALLSAAVISLAAMTGIEATRASDFEKRAANLTAALASVTSANGTATATGDNPQATSFSALTNGCSDDPDGTTGTNYTTFKLLGQKKFTMSCNKDTPNWPVLSLFTSNFQTCMDACSAYSKYMPGVFDKDNKNTTCVAVSFIPLWTVKQDADDGGAPGNCYLKPGPVKLSDLKDANIGTECHSAVLVNQT